MRPAHTLKRRFASIATIVAMMATTAIVSVAFAPAAAAAPSPLQDTGADRATADALPTVQIDGVVWSQAIAGNIVWAGGGFANARPAGAAAGTNQTAALQPGGVQHRHRRHDELRRQPGRERPGARRLGLP